MTQALHRPPRLAATLRAVAFFVFVASLLPAAAVAGSAARKKADAITQEGKRRFRGGEVAIAKQLFVKAAELDPRPDRTYNIARCDEALGQLDDAIRGYDAYLAVSKDVAGRAEAQVRRDNLQRKLEQQRKEKAEAEAKRRAAELAAKEKAEAERRAAEQAEAERRTAEQSRARAAAAANAAAAERRRTGMWTMTGGGATALVGIGLLVSGVALDASLQSDVDQRGDGGLVTGVTEADAFARRDRNTALRSAGVVSSVIGALAAGAGFYLWWEGAPPAQVALTPAGVALGGRF